MAQHGLLTLIPALNFIFSKARLPFLSDRAILSIVLLRFVGRLTGENSLIVTMHPFVSEKFRSFDFG